MAKKRSKGEGCIRKLKSGNWHGEIMDGYTDDGKKNIVSFSASTRAEVLDLIRSYKNNCDDHLHLDKTIDFSSWSDTWYADYESQVAASTYAGYKYTLKILKDYFKSAPLCEILPMHINKFMDSLVEKKYSMSQIRKCRTMLIQIFDAADANGLVARNPASKAKIIHDKDGSLSKKMQKDAFTEEEVKLLFAQLENDLLGHSVRLMLGTGLRVQELLALRSEDISDDGAMITVDEAIKTVDGVPELGCTKSLKGNRVVPVLAAARESALFLKHHGSWPLIWSHQGNNECYSVGCFRRRYYTALEKIPGVRKLSPHCCRHTYVSRLQGKGVPMETIARIVGHSSIVTTNEYTHISFDALARAVSVLDA